LLLASSAYSAARLRRHRLPSLLALWLLIVASMYYAYLLALGSALEPDIVRAALSPDVILAFKQPSAPASPEALARDLSVWAAMAAVAGGWAAFSTIYRRSESREDAVALALAATWLLAAAVSIVFTGLTTPSLAVLTAALAPYLLAALRGAGLASLNDELTMVVAVGAGLSLAIAATYLAVSGLTTAQLMMPLSVGGQALVAGDDYEKLEPAPIWERVAEEIAAISPRKVYVWPYYGAIIEALAGVEATTLDDGAEQLYVAARLLTGDEGEAAYILGSVEGLSPGQAVVVVREVFVGRYEAQTGVVILYPRPVLVQALATRSFIIQGVGDLSNLYTNLQVSGRIEEGVSPFDSGWESEAVVQGFATIMFPGLTGNPADNVARARETLAVKLALDAVFKLSTNGVLLEGCEFIPQTAVYVPGVFLSTPGGGIVQPLFIITETERFEPVKVVMSCPQILSDTGLRVEFTAEMVAIYAWKG
jgi:hypothetical protein